jgi:hypothetical protein
VIRTLALVAVSLALGAGQAAAATQEFRIVVVPDLSLADLEQLADRGAVGLLVVSNGPSTSGAQARAALTRGKLRNSYLDGGVPTGPAIVEFETAAVPPTSGPAIVLGLPSDGKQPNDRRYPIVVLGHGYHGLLTSPSTRLPGVVSIVDVAPTALGEDDGLGWSANADAGARVVALDELIGGKKRLRLEASLLAGGLIVLLALVFPRAAILSYATALAAAVPLGAAEAHTAWVVLLAIAAAILAAVLLAFVLRSALAVGLALAAVLALYLAAMAVDAAWVAYSTFGPEQAGRFYGVGNLLETMLLVPALAGAAFLGRSLGALGFAAVALLAFVTIVGGRFGADGGGAVVLAAGYALLAALLMELRGRALVAPLGAAGVLAGALIALDAATGGSSHVSKALGGGPESLSSRIFDRLQISWAHATTWPGPVLSVFLTVPLLVFLVARLLASEAPLAQRALPLAYAGALAVSLLANDSPNEVAIAGFVGFVVCERVMLRGRCAAASCLRSPLAFSWPAAGGRRMSRPPQKP